MDGLLSPDWPYHRPPIPMYQTDHEGHLLHVNRHWLALLRLDGDGVQGRALVSFMTEASRGEYERHAGDPPGPGHYLESQFVAADGTVIDVLLSFAAERDTVTAEVSVLGAMIDLTARRAAEREAARSAALLASVTTHANDAILITEAWPIDLPGPRVLYSNPAFTAMTGYSAEEIRAGTPRVLQGAKTDRRELDRLRRALETWQSVRVELVNQRKDGTEFDVEIDVSPVADRDGVYTHWVAIQRNITDRRRLEEQRLRTLVEGVPQLLWRSCDQGEWTWASPQWLKFTGQTQEESHGHGWMMAVHPDDHPATLVAWELARPHGTLEIEFRVRRAADGAYVWHQTRSTPVRDGAGRIVEWLGTTTDIQDLKDMQGRQGVLLAELQHRTRNLLAVVQAIARQTLRRSSSLGQFTADYESRLGALSRVQGLLAQANHETLDLRQLVTLELAAHRDGVADRVTVTGPPVELAATAVQVLALALHELATNAVKHGALGQPGARLAVTWRVEGAPGSVDEDRRQVVLDWQESGVAMPDAGSPARKGYGSELIERALPYQLKARTRLEFGADGVRCAIALPIGGTRVGARDGTGAGARVLEAAHG